MDLHYDLPMILMPEHMIANGEVWDAFKEIQAKLAQQESLIEEKFLEQQNAIQTAHTQMMQGLELQNQQMENQHLFNKVSAGLFCAVLLVAIIQMIITIVQNNKIRKMQKKIDQMEEENSQYASCQKEQEKKLEGIWNTIYTVGEQIRTIQGGMSRQQMVISVPAAIPKPVKQPLKTALSQQMVRIAAEQREGWGARVEQYLMNEYSLRIGYYQRHDPNGRVCEGVAEQVNDEHAPFFGVVTDGHLFLLPNKAYLPLLSCAGEFFKNYQNTGNGFSSISCAILNQEGNFWRIAELGSIN